jgi:hypothetical protein
MRALLFGRGDALPPPRTFRARGELLLFHHAQGQTDGFAAFAEELCLTYAGASACLRRMPAEPHRLETLDRLFGQGAVPPRETERT